MSCKPTYKGERYNSLEEIKEIIKKEYPHKDGIKIDELPITTTLNDLAEIMAYGNNKIILPGYKVEYSTPLGNKYDTLEEVNNEIRSLADANVEVDLSGVKINRELSKEELEKIKELETQKKEKEDYFNSKKYQQDKDFELHELNKQLNALKNKKVEFHSQEPFLNLEDKEKYGFQDFDYIRVESTYGRGNEYHKDDLGENYEGYYIHGYNTSAGKPKKKILPISKEQAKEIWKKDESSKYEVGDKQNILRLENSIEYLKSDSKIKWGIQSLEQEIKRVKNGESSILNFIEKNKEYEQAREIIAQWKKENNIQYDPEEVYSRGQGFYSSIGAYSNLELDLLLKNLIQHIQDNKKASENSLIKDSDKIIFGHPGIGKTHLKESGRKDIIDFDSDYKSKINKQFNLPEGFKARNDFQKSNKEEYQEAVRKLWVEAKNDAKRTGKKLFASDMILLREFSNDFDKVITMSKETFVNRAKQRNDYTPGLEGTEGWKNNLDKEIGKIDKSKVHSTDKYLSDLLDSSNYGFTISAFTKPIDKRLKHIEGTGDRVRFVIYPKSEHIKWAAPTDVYSGSVWDAHEKVSKDKKSELLGVSFTKAPSLVNINEVSSNLADIIDNLSHAHNELGIELTTNNFRIEYDDNIDYSTKKLIDNFNKILDDKYGKLEKPEIKKADIEKYRVKDVQYFEGELFEDFQEFNTKEEAEEYVESKKYFSGHRLTIEKYSGKQPTQTKSNTTSIESVKSKVLSTANRPKSLEELQEGDGFIYFEKDGKYFKEDLSKQVDIEITKEEYEGSKKEYTNQALINLKIAALKEVARKYPRSLITSKVVPINPNMIDNSEIQYSKRENIENLQNEINIKPEFTNSTLLLNLKEQGYYKSIPENVLGTLSKYGVLSRYTKSFEDRWYFVRGELNQNNNINDNIARYNQFMSMNNINKDMFIFNNTKEDRAPYLTVNPKFKEEDTIVENNEKIHKEKYEAIIQFFQDKFGIKKEQIVYTTKEKFKKQFPEAYQENMQSVYSDGKFYFFTRNLTSDITVEELLHPFIYTVKELNPQLFNNLLKEAKLHYPKLNTKIQTLYANRSKSTRDQELVTQALSRVFNNIYENEEPQSFIETIKDFVKWIKEIMSSIFNYFKTGKYINIPIEKLDPHASLYEIAKIINAVDTRFDVIFPTKTLHSLEENTSDFNRTVEKILTDEKVTAKINEIFVKLPTAIKNIKNRLNNTINEIEKKNLQSIIKSMEELENEDNENLIAFQLKGIIASVQLSNELLKNLNAMAFSNNDDNIKLSYYMSVYKTAKAMDGFKDLMIELKDELSSNLVLSNTKDVNTFIGMLGKAISSEDEIAHKIQKLVKAPLLNKLVESSEYAYQPKMEELKNKIADLENQINKTASQKEKDNLFNKISPLRRELKLFQEKAPTKENLQKIFDGVFKDANILSHIFEAKIANGNPLVATLQNIINDIYDSAGRDMLDYKNEAQSQMEKYSKATGIGLRDQERRYEQIRDVVKLPTNILLDDNKNPVLDSENNYQFEYVNQDTLLSNIDNDYLTQYLELEMIKDFLLEKHRENTYNNTPDEETYKKYREALVNFQNFIKENSEREYSDKIYEFKAIMDEVIGGKTLREITSNFYNELDEQQVNLEAAADTAARMQILERIKDINIELKRLRTEYYEDGSKKEGDDLKIAQLLTKYNKLRNEYYSSTLSESAQKRYEFDKQELEKKKQQYIDDNNESTYRNNLKRIEQEIISPDYFTALSGITGEINELSNLLSEAAATQIPQYIDKNIFKQQKKDVYNEIRELAKPYRDEDGVIDGSAMLKRHPEVALKIRDLQQYIEDLKFETSNIGKLSIAESNELSSLRQKELKSQEEEARLLELATKQKAFSNFKKQNEELLKQLNNLYQQLDDLTTTHTTDYFEKEKQKQLDLLKINPQIIVSAKEFVKSNTQMSIDGVFYQKGGEERDSDIWYREQVLGKKIDFIPLDRQGDSGYNEILDIVTGYLAKLSLEDTEWWKNNHFTINFYDEKNKTWSKKDRPIYIWEHLTPNNPNFIETKPAKQYYKYEVKDEFLNKNYNTTYREIPVPKKGKFENSRYNDIVKNKPVFEFLQYFTKEYLADQEIYSIRGKAVKMGYVLPAVAKTSGENAVNITNKLLSFDGTFTEMFKENVQATDNDTSYLVGGGQTNNKIVPIRFVGKIDTKAQTKNIVASLLLFKYHASLYKALNESLPVFEASQLLASNVDVLKAKNYADKLSFSKKIFNMFSSKRRKEEELETKDVEKSVLSKSVDDVLNIFVYGQRMKPEILNLGPLGTVDLAKVSSGILGLAAKSIFIGNIFSAINNSLSTRLQVIINADVKSNLYSLQNMRNAQAKAPKYTKDMLSDWTKLGNKSLIGQVLDHFAFLAENPVREITSKSEFTKLKNKMELLTSPKQMSEFEVLFLQFLTVADATPVKVNGKINKLSNIEDIFEIKDGKFKIKDGVEFSKEQEKIFRGKYQSVARKIAGAYRTTEISSLETNWAGKSGMFLRRYFVGMATNRFQGSRFSFQEGDVYTGYQREVFKNIVNLFTEYKGNLPKYYNQLSDKEKAAHLKMLTEYGLLIVFMGLFNLMGGDKPKKELKKNSYAYNLSLVALLRAKTELQQFTFAGIDDLTRIGKNPFMVFQTIGNITKVIWLVKPTIFGEKSAYYQQNTGLHKEGDSKLVANFLKVIGYTGATWHPEEYIVNFRNAQNR